MTHDELIAYYGTQRAAGEALAALGADQAVSQSSVAEWKTTGIPGPRQAQYEIITRGKLRADRPRRKAA